MTCHLILQWGGQRIAVQMLVSVWKLDPWHIGHRYAEQCRHFGKNSNIFLQIESKLTIQLRNRKTVQVSINYLLGKHEVSRNIQNRSMDIRLGSWLSW